jgi:hypothetical protein
MNVMLAKKVMTLLFVLTFSVAHAQSFSFCEALDSLVRDAGSLFKNVKGAQLSANEKNIVWACKLKVPDMQSARIVHFMGLFYEGGFYQTRDTTTLWKHYQECVSKMNSCLLPKGYKAYAFDNYEKELTRYKKKSYFLEAEGAKATTGRHPHVSIEVAVNKGTGTYSIVIYVYA